MLKLYMFNSAN